jgi:hypothetical protein
MSETTFHGTGVRFDNGYESEHLAQILESVMQHQNFFVLPANLGRQGLLQISTPTEEQRSAQALGFTTLSSVSAQRSPKPLWSESSSLAFQKRLSADPDADPCGEVQCSARIFLSASRHT